MFLRVVLVCCLAQAIAILRVSEGAAAAKQRAMGPGSTTTTTAPAAAAAAAGAAAAAAGEGEEAAPPLLYRGMADVRMPDAFFLGQVHVTTTLPSDSPLPSPLTHPYRSSATPSGPSRTPS